MGWLISCMASLNIENARDISIYAKVGSANVSLGCCGLWSNSKAAMAASVTAGIAPQSQRLGCQRGAVAPGLSTSASVPFETKEAAQAISWSLDDSTSGTAISGSSAIRCSSSRLSLSSKMGVVWPLIVDQRLIHLTPHMFPCRRSHSWISGGDHFLVKNP